MVTDWDVVDDRFFQLLARAYEDGYAQGVEDAAQGVRSVPNPFSPADVKAAFEARHPDGNYEVPLGRTTIATADSCRNYSEKDRVLCTSFQGHQGPHETWYAGVHYTWSEEDPNGGE